MAMSAAAAGADGPYELPLATRVLYSPEGVKVIILGTAHISKKSVVEAQELVRHVQPRVVVVELCRRRKAMLQLPLDGQIAKAELNVASMQAAIRESGSTGLMTLVISSLTWDMADRIGLEITPGTEFAAAYQETLTYGGKVFLGDRSVDITLKRAWRALGIGEKLRLIWSMVFEPLGDLDEETVEKMKDSDMLTQMMADLGEQYPDLMEPLIFERDRFIRYKLRDCCKQMATYLNRPDTDPTERLAGGNTVVAIVGMGHMNGICADWGEPIDIADQERITSIPPIPVVESVLYYTALASLLVGGGVVGYAVWHRIKRG